MRAVRENLVWVLGVFLCVSLCVCREQLFVKEEMWSFRGPDGIQLREIKWWWIAVRQQRPTLMCVFVRTHTLTYTYSKKAADISNQSFEENCAVGKEGEKGEKVFDPVKEEQNWKIDEKEKRKSTVRLSSFWEMRGVSLCSSFFLWQTRRINR